MCDDTLAAFIGALNGDGPVLRGHTIPGKNPELAAKLRDMADRLNELADEYDDQYQPPSIFLRYCKPSDASAVMTWRAAHVKDDE